LCSWGAGRRSEAETLADPRGLIPRGVVPMFIGSREHPDHFEPIKYEDSKGNLIVQPDNQVDNQFPGRFAFTELKNRGYVLDTVTGNMWIPQGSYGKPIKLTLVPRKD